MAHQGLWRHVGAILTTEDQSISLVLSSTCGGLFERCVPRLDLSLALSFAVRGEEK
jgi:hypothetical protein